MIELKTIKIQKKKIVVMIIFIADDMIKRVKTFMNNKIISGSNTRTIQQPLLMIKL